MTLHPDSQRFLDALRAYDLPACVHDGSRPDIPAAELRARVAALPRPPAQPIAGTEDLTIPGPGGAVPARLYRPADCDGGLVVYFHGGGWVLGGLDSHDGLCRSLATAGRCLVLAVDYRLAPEHPFPAAVEDSIAVASWVAEHLDELGAGPDRLAVAGDSAGGNLAAVVAREMRHRGLPEPAVQILIYPVTDFTFDSASYTTYARDVHLGRDLMIWFRDMYLGGADGVDLDHPWVAPLRWDDVAGLPETVIITAECDPLRDDGWMFAERLRAAGVPVTYLEYEGMVHSFINWGPTSSEAGDAVAQAAGALRAAFDQRATTNGQEPA